MAAGSPGAVGNAEFGFTPDDSSVVTVDSTNVGFLQGDIEINVPREYAFLQLDQVRVDLDHVCIRKEMVVTLSLGEVLLGNIGTAFDNDDVSSPISIDDSLNGTVDLDINTTPPNFDGSDTRAIALPTAVSVGDTTYTIGQSSPQVLNGLSFKAIADSSQVLGTITDTYA